MLINQSDCFYVYMYTHIDGSPYYIGKGKGNRMYASHKHRRNEDLLPRTNGILDKTRITVIQDQLTEKDAHLLESKLICKYGRLDLGTGILHNKTDGGEGFSNKSVETKCKISKALTGIKRSDATIRKCKEAQKQRKLSGFDYSSNIIKANRTRYESKKYWFYSEKYGTDYGYITDIAKKYGIKPHGFYQQLNGRVKMTKTWVLIRPSSEMSLKATEVKQPRKELTRC